MSVKKLLSSRKPLTFIIALGIGISLTSCNNSAETSDIKQRTDTMKNWKDAMGIMGNMLENPDRYDSAKFAKQAAFLAADANTPWVHFADATVLGKATENVWSDPESFQQEIDHYQQVTASLNAAAQNALKPDDVATAYKDVGASCKSCHKQFKIKEDR